MSSLVILLPSLALRSSSGNASSQLPAVTLGRRLEHQVAQHVGNHIQAFAIGGKPAGVARGELRHFLLGFSRAYFQILIVVQGQEVGELALDDPQPVARQIQIADDLGVQQRHRVSRD